MLNTVEHRRVVITLKLNLFVLLVKDFSKGDDNKFERGKCRVI